MTRKSPVSSEKGNGKHKRKTKRAQETNDTSVLTIHSKAKISGNKTITKLKEDMSSLSNLIRAAKIVENSPRVPINPGKNRKGKNVSKPAVKVAAVKPNPKIGKKLKKIKDVSMKRKSNSDVDIDGDSDDEDSEGYDSEETESEEESIEALKYKVTMMMAKLERLEGTKRKRRKRKNRKGKSPLPDDDDEDTEVDIKPSKSQKKIIPDGASDVNIKTKSENSDSTVSVTPDNNMTSMIQYQQMMMMQHMYMYSQNPFLQQPAYQNFTPQQYAPQLMSTCVDPITHASTQSINTSSKTEVIFPGNNVKSTIVPVAKSSSNIVASFSDKERYENVDIHLNGIKVETKKEERQSSKNSTDNENHNDYDSDASVVYELDVIKPSEQKPTEENPLITEKLLTVDPANPTSSFIGFCDDIVNGLNNEGGGDSIQSTVVSSTKKPSTSKESLTNTKNSQQKQPTVSEESPISVEKGRSSSQPESKNKLKMTSKLTSQSNPPQNIADILMNLLPQQVRNEVTSYSEPDLSDRPEINTALRTMIEQSAKKGTIPANLEKDALKTALIKMLSDKQENMPPPLVSKFRTPPPPDVKPQSDRKSYADNASWMRECTHNLYLQDQDGDTILHILIAKEEEVKAIDVIKKMKGYRLDILNALGQTPLHLAMYIRNIKIIETLLQHGADVSIVDAHGNSPLHIACEENSLEMVQVLFDYQLSHKDKYEQIMQIRNNQGMAAIHISTHKENDDILKFLVHRKIDLNIQEGRSGNTPLVMALSKGNWERAEFFIQNTASVNIPNFSNCYPLHFAVQGNKMEMVKNLLSRGAEMGSKANEYDSGKDSEIKTLLAKEMRKRRRRQKAKDEFNTQRM